MKKFWLMLTLLTAMLLATTTPSVKAERIRGDGNIELYREVCYDQSYGANRRTVADCGLIVDYVGLLKTNAIDLTMENSGDVYWFKSGVMGDVSVIGVEGVVLELTNPTSAPITVQWSDSSLSLGSFEGVPSTSASLDAGKPADTRVLPGKTVVQRVYIAKTRQVSGDTVRAAAYVRTDNSLAASLYLHVLTQPGRGEYITANSPAILIPDFVLEPFREQNS